MLLVSSFFNLDAYEMNTLLIQFSSPKINFEKIALKKSTSWGGGSRQGGGGVENLFCG